MRDTTIHNRWDYPYDVFVSYCSKDLKIVQQAVRTLKRYGYRIWHDQEILGKYPGDYYNEHIYEGIDQSALVLYFHSKDSIKDDSYAQKYELPYATAHHKHILSYRCYGTDIALPTRLGNRETIVPLCRPGSNETDELFSIRVAVQRSFGDLTPEGMYVKLETNPQIWKPEDICSELSRHVFTLPIPESRREALEQLGFRSCPEDSAEMYSQLCRFITESGCTADAPAFIEATACEVADYFRQLKEEGKTIFNGPNIGVERIVPERTDDGEETHKLYIRLYRSNYFTFKVTSRLYEKLRKQNRDLFSVNTTRDLQRFAPFLCSLGVGGFVKAIRNGKPCYLWVKRSTECEASDLYHFSYDETVAVKDIRTDARTGKESIDLYTTLYRGMREELGLYPEHLMGEGGIFEIGLILTDKRIELELLSYEGITEEAYKNFRSLLESAEDSRLEIGDTYFWSLQDYKRELTDQLLTPESLALIQRIETRDSHENN